MKKIIFCSGGTGGHIFPAVTMLDYLSDSYKTVLVTDKRALKYIESIKFKTEIIEGIQFKKKNFFYNLFSIFKLLNLFIKSIKIIIKEKPDIVFGFGGYASVPILISAKLLNKKIYLYEPNLIIGRANKLFLSSCQKIFTSTNKIKNYSIKYKNKFIEVGNIIRKEVTSFPVNKLPKDNKEKNIIILGGSQGAQIFAEIVPRAILNLIENNIKVNIIQQALPYQIKMLKDFYYKNNISCNVFDFKSNISELISKSDIAISRSGASTTAELECLQVPFIAVPYPFAKDNHQYENALYYMKNDECWILEQKNFTCEKLSSLLINIFNKPKDLQNKKKKMIYNRKTNTLEIIKKEIEI